MLLTTVQQADDDLEDSPDADVFIIQGFGTKFKSSRSLILEQQAYQCIYYFPILCPLSELHSFEK